MSISSILAKNETAGGPSFSSSSSSSSSKKRPDVASKMWTARSLFAPKGLNDRSQAINAWDAPKKAIHPVGYSMIVFSIGPL